MRKTTFDVLAAEPDLDRALSHVLQTMTEQLESPSASLWLVNSDSNTFSPHLIYWQGEVVSATAQTIEQLEWLHEQPIPCHLRLNQQTRDRTPVICNADQCPHSPDLQRQWMDRRGIKTLLSVPLLFDARIIGSFMVRFTQLRQFAIKELALTQALAHQATLSIQANQAKQAALHEERHRLAEEIHDTSAQAFTSISVQVGLAQWLIQQDPIAVPPILDRIKLLIQAGLRESSRSVWSLYPAVEDDMNLAHKLSYCLEQCACDVFLKTNLQVVGTPYPIPAIVCHNLMRIGQEAIINVLKHAQANTLEVVLMYSVQIISLCVKDDGCGFASKLNSGGFGLISIAKRVDRINGQLLIQSQPGKGTEIRVEVPV